MYKTLALAGCICLSSAFSAAALAGSGKAIVPHWTGGNNSDTSVFVSNLSRHNLVVTITFYDQTGTVRTAENYYGFVSGNTEIAAGGTGYVNIGQAGVIGQGYAVIEWKNRSGENDTVGLVAHAVRGRADAWRYAIPVSGGAPF